MKPDAYVARVFTALLGSEVFVWTALVLDSMKSNIDTRATLIVCLVQSCKSFTFTLECMAKTRLVVAGRFVSGAMCAFFPVCSNFDVYVLARLNTRYLKRCAQQLPVSTFDPG